MGAVHDPGCRLLAHSDAAKRCSDAVNLHLSALGVDAMRRWVAVRLSDGSSDGTLYDTKRDAVRAQSDEYLCAYVCVPPSGMNPCQAESFMATHRKLYDNGFRLADPDAPSGGRSIIPALTREDHRRQVACLRR